MSLNVCTKVYNKEDWIQFYINGTGNLISEIPKLRNNNATVALKHIEAIQADGDELEYIRARFENLPVSHGICVWRGEMAKFIWENLR